MQTFQCKAADQNGRIIGKNIVADSKASAKKILDQEGYFALEINKKGGFFASIKQGPGLKSFKSKDFLFFNQEFSVLIRAGLSIVAALDI
ncbi:MAG: type II secretion system F family protein, partial [Deltaproteobacteria bacterium]|nr:type II secretion system F family protein [Deltaproteobacteria bacterium]